MSFGNASTICWAVHCAVGCSVTLKWTTRRRWWASTTRTKSTRKRAVGTVERLHVLRRINEEQAAVVRRIFDLCAGGMGFTRIAKALNRDGVMPPRGDGRGWAPTAVREMLYRPLYRGQIVWNKSQKIDRGGTRSSAAARPRSGSSWTRRSYVSCRRICGRRLTRAWSRLVRRSREPEAAASSSGDPRGSTWTRPTC